MSDLSNGLAEYEFANTALLAQHKTFAVRDPGAHLPLEMVVWDREGGQWAVVTIDDPHHALAEAVKLIEGARARLRVNT